MQLIPVFEAVYALESSPSAAPDGDGGLEASFSAHRRLHNW